MCQIFFLFFFFFSSSSPSSSSSSNVRNRFQRVGCPCPEVRVVESGGWDRSVKKDFGRQTECH